MAWVKCFCKGAICKGGDLTKPFSRRYTCPTCKRSVPWCFGGTDSEDCDDCWDAKRKS